jgi:hypothetical protein
VCMCVCVSVLLARLAAALMNSASRLTSHLSCRLCGPPDKLPDRNATGRLLFLRPAFGWRQKCASAEGLPKELLRRPSARPARRAAIAVFVPFRWPAGPSFIKRPQLGEPAKRLNVQRNLCVRVCVSLLPGAGLAPRPGTAWCGRPGRATMKLEAFAQFVGRQTEARARYTV